MNLLVLECCKKPRRLLARLAAATRQDIEDLTVVLITREGKTPDARILEIACSNSGCDFVTMQLRDDDGLGSLLRLVRKRYKDANKIAICFDDETLVHPQALRRMFAEVGNNKVYAVTGYVAADGSAQRNGDVADGALPSFLADRIDGLAVAELDALDAIHANDADGRRTRRRVLAESLIRSDASAYVTELLVERDIASIRVEYARADAPVTFTPVTTGDAASPATAPTQPTTARKGRKQDDTPEAPHDFDDEPLLARAFRQDEASRTISSDQPVRHDEEPASVAFDPGLSMDVDTSFASESLDDDAKALLTELATEGRLDLEELEASLSDDDASSILFVSRLPGLPVDFRKRMRAKFIDAGGDPELVREEEPAAKKAAASGSLSMDDLGVSDLDADTRAILEAAIEGPPDLSWLEEDVEDESATRTGNDAEPDDYAIDDALDRLRQLEKKLEDEELEDEKPSALDGWFEDFEREEEEKSPSAPTASEPEPPATKARKKLDIDFTLEPESNANPLAWKPASEFDGIRDRAREIASQIAESLVSLQQPNGEFLEPERFAKECAAALWHGLDRQLYRGAIQKALDASQRRAEALTLQNQDDGHAPMRAYALGAMGFADAARQPLDGKYCIDTLVEAVLCSRRGEVFDLKRVNMVRRALDDTGALFDRWAPEDPDASVLSARDQAFATLLASELALRNPDQGSIVSFARELEDRLLALARTKAGAAMSIAASAYRCADRRDDGNLMHLIIDRFANSSWDGADNSNGEGHSESLSYSGLHLAFDPALESAEAY
ncbi:MAG: hypothetical protein H6832_04765 [Planctomycetes bacterium]|nr:hypothetical protein [Planctomycetota bacterium]MCB9890452.1 hypothetical protein [Planctomycetota bacterium]MCB9917693.1 hypothetical protein [Planctomycetota bacterium]